MKHLLEKYGFWAMILIPTSSFPPVPGIENSAGHDPLRIFSAPPGTRIPDQAWRYHRCRQKFRLRFFQRAGSGDHQGTGHPLCDRQILCRIFFRNSINNGLLLIENPDLRDRSDEGETRSRLPLEKKLSYNGKKFLSPLFRRT